MSRSRHEQNLGRQCSGGRVAGGEVADWLAPSPPGSETSVRAHPGGSIGTRRCASYPSRARHRAPLQPRGRLGGGPDFGVFEGGQVRRLRPPGVKLRPPGTLVVPLVGVPIFGGWGTDLSLPVRKSFPVTATPPPVAPFAVAARVHSVGGRHGRLRVQLEPAGSACTGPLARACARSTRRAVGLLTHRAPFCD